jgi:hypothetical protein
MTPATGIKLCSEKLSLQRFLHFVRNVEDCRKIRKTSSFPAIFLYVFGKLTVDLRSSACGVPLLHTPAGVFAPTNQNFTIDKMNCND